MSKDKFKGINTGDIYSNQIEAATAEPAPKEITPIPKGQAPTAEQLQELREANRTRGRKGCKMLRVNMAFYPDVHDYLRTMAQVRGQTLTQFCNDVFRKSMEENAAIYEQAKKFKEIL